MISYWGVGQVRPMGFSAHLAVLVALAGHDDGGDCVLHKQHVVCRQRQSEGQPARLHAAAAVELQVCAQGETQQLSSVQTE
jgi:hypothetical protein